MQSMLQRQREAMVDKGRFLTRRQAEDVSMRLYTARTERPVVRLHRHSTLLPFLALPDLSFHFTLLQVREMEACQVNRPDNFAGALVR
jgi:hypothetical protein